MGDELSRVRSSEKLCKSFDGSVATGARYHTHEPPTNGDHPHIFTSSHPHIKLTHPMSSPTKSDHSHIRTSSHLHISIPLTWTALTDPQLHYLCTLIASEHYTLDEVRAHFIIRTAHFTPYALRHLQPIALVEAMDTLDWLEQPPTEPVRYQQLDNHPAQSPTLLHTPFQDYLSVENYYQAYLSTQNVAALQAIATVLYPGFTRQKLTADEQYMLLLWLVGLKTHYTQLFPHLFRQATSPDQEPPDPRDIMNAQIRALTAGDITKTTAVMHTDTHTALTELDAKAREAQELERITHNKV